MQQHNATESVSLRYVGGRFCALQLEDLGKLGIGFRFIFINPK